MSLRECSAPILSAQTHRKSLDDERAHRHRFRKPQSIGASPAPIFARGRAARPLGIDVETSGTIETFSETFCKTSAPAPVSRTASRPFFNRRWRRSSSSASLRTRSFRTFENAFVFRNDASAFASAILCNDLVADKVLGIEMSYTGMSLHPRVHEWLRVLGCHPRWTKAPESDEISTKSF